MRKRPNVPQVEYRTEKPAARLECWQLIRTSMPSWHFLGVVFGHVRLMDGGVIITSDLVDVHAVAAGGIRAETLNTIYRLGAPWVGELSEEYCMVARENLGDDWWPVLIEEH